MTSQTFNTFACAYRNLLTDLVSTGEEAGEIRGRGSKEILNYSFCIENPASNLVYIEGRKFSIMHAILESLGLFIDDDSVRFASLFNKRMAEFSDDGKTLHGCYGKRISPHLEDVIEKLQKDENSRSAVISIYNADKDFVKTKDIPCTETVQFLIRNGRLNMVVNMRSNDCIWGTPYDVFMFTNLQMVLANTLGVGLGRYYHNVGSMHLYDDMYEMAEKMLNKQFIAIEKRNVNSLYCWEYLAKFLSNIANNKINEKFTNNIWFIRRVMEDKSYLVAIVKELVYRGIISKNEVSEIGEEDWLKPFTKRWHK